MSKTVVGMDFGGSASKVGIRTSEGDWQWQTLTRQQLSADRASVEAFLQELPMPPGRLITTGGRSRQLEGVPGVTHQAVDEMAAIGMGARLEREEERLLAVSLGTGTACVRVVDEMFDHVGGTALGGGTLQGLSKLLLGTSVVSELEAMAEQGDRWQLDKSVGDIVGEDLDWLKASDVAGHFAKALSAPDPDPSDLAAAVFGLVVEPIGLLTASLAREHGCAGVVILGQLAESPLVRSHFRRAGERQGVRFHFPEAGRYQILRGALKLAGIDNLPLAD